MRSVDVDSSWIVQQMVEIQAPKAFKKIAQSVDDLVSVDKIISKSIKGVFSVTEGWQFPNTGICSITMLIYIYVFITITASILLKYVI
jgi:hypothetical protein